VCDPAEGAPEIFLESHPFTDELVRWYWKRIKRSDRVELALSVMQSITNNGQLIAPPLVEHLDRGPMLVASDTVPPYELHYRNALGELLGRVVYVAA